MTEEFSCIARDTVSTSASRMRTCTDRWLRFETSWPWNGKLAFPREVRTSGYGTRRWKLDQETKLFFLKVNSLQKVPSRDEVSPLEVSMIPEIKKRSQVAN